MPGSVIRERHTELRWRPQVCRWKPSLCLSQARIESASLQGKDSLQILGGTLDHRCLKLRLGLVRRRGIGPRHGNEAQVHITTMLVLNLRVVDTRQLSQKLHGVSPAPKSPLDLSLHHVGPQVDNCPIACVNPRGYQLLVSLDDPLDLLLDGSTLAGIVGCKLGGNLWGRIATLSQSPNPICPRSPCQFLGHSRRL